MPEQDRSEGVPLSNEDRYRMESLIEEVSVRQAEMARIMRRVLGQKFEELGQKFEEIEEELGASTDYTITTERNGKTTVSICKDVGSGKGMTECYCYNDETQECTPGPCPGDVPL